MANIFDTFQPITPTSDTTQAQESDASYIQPTAVPTAKDNKSTSLTGRKKSKFERLAPEKANTLDAEDLQFKVGEALGDDQIFTREDGSLYQNKRNSLGEYEESDYVGETQDVYIDNTEQGNMKLGLASLGFDKRYTPDGSGYGWAPGAEGVTTEDGALMNVKLPKTKAQELEFMVHSNKGQIENRVGGNTLTDYKKQKLGSKLGGGASEYTTPEAPLWNIDYKSKDEPLGSDVMMPGIPKYIQDAERLKEYERTSGGYAGNLIDGLQFSAGRLAAEIADSFVDASTRLVKDGLFKTKGKTEAEASSDMLKELTFSKDWFDKDMNFTALDKYKEAEEYQYDDTDSKEATENLGKAYESGSVLDMAAALGSGVIKAGPAWVAESAAYMLMTRNPVLLSLTAIGQSNEFAEDIQDHLGTKDIGYARRLGALGASAVVMGIEKLGVDELVGKTNFVKKLMGSAIDGNKKTGKAAVKALGKKVLSVAGVAGYEGLTEATQQAVELYATKYGTDAEKELFSGEFGKELFQAFGGGFGAGAVMSGARETATGLKSGKSELDKKISDIKVKEDAKEEVKQAGTYDYANMSPDEVSTAYETNKQVFKTESGTVNPKDIIAQADEMEKAIDAKESTLDEASEQDKLNYNSEFKSMKDEIYKRKDEAYSSMSNAWKIADDAGKDSNEYKAFSEQMNSLSSDDQQSIIEKRYPEMISEMAKSGMISINMDNIGKISIEEITTDKKEDTAEKPIVINPINMNNIGMIQIPEVNVEQTAKVIDTAMLTKTEPEVIVEDGLVAETGQTDTHTEGFSERLIRKLAKDVGLEAVDVQATLNSAMPQFALMNMKNVSKASNEVQYEIYHGKNGVIPTYAKYRSALAKGDNEVALQAIQTIQKKGYTQERKLNRYAVKYEELVSKIEQMRDTAIARADGKNEDEAVASAIKLLKGADFKPAYSKSNLNVNDVSQDVELSDGVRALLGSEGKESNTIQIMQSMDESIQHIDGLLSTSGHGRQRDRGVVVEHKDDVARYVENITDKESELTELEAKTDKDLIDEGRIVELKKSIAGLKQGLERLGTRSPIESARRWATVDKTIDVAGLKKELTKLESFKKKTQDKKDRIVEIKEILAEQDSEQASIEAIKKNIGKKAGKKSEGATDIVKDTKTGFDVVKKLRTKRGAIEKTIAPSEVVETEDTTFVSQTGKSELKAEITKLGKNKAKREKIASRFDKIIKSYSTKYESLADELKEFTDGRTADALINSDKVIANSQKTIIELRAKVVELQDKKKSIAKGLERSLNKRADEIGQTDEEITQIKSEMISDLMTLRDELDKGEMIGEGKSVIKKASKSILKKLAKLAMQTKGLHNIAYRFIQKELASELNQSIARLEKSIKAEEIKIEHKKAIKADAYAEIKDNDSIESANKARRLIMQINKVRDRRSDAISKKKTALTKLNDMIKSIKDKLSNTTEIERVMSDGLKPANKTKKSKKGYEQQLDIAKSIEFKPTILGSAPIQTLTELMDADTKTKFDEEFKIAKKQIEDGMKLKTSEFKGKTTIDRDFQLYDSPLSGLLYDNNGNINDQMVAAIVLSGWSWIGNSGANNLFNSSSDIARMRGYADESQVSGAERNLFKRAGSFRKVVSHTLGENLLSELGIVIKEGVPREMRDKIVSDAGLLTLGYLNSAELIENMNDTRITVAQWNNVVSEAEYLKEPNNIPMIKTKEDKLERYSELGKLLREIEKSLEIDPLVKNYRTSKSKKSDEDYAKVRGSVWTVPEESQATMKTLENEKYSVVDAVDELTAIYGDGEAGRTAYLKAVGWKDIDVMKKDTSYLRDEIDTQESQNRELEHNYDEMIDMVDRLNKGIINNEVYFNWFFSKNGRYMMDSAGVNPQSDKLLHRWLVLPKSAQNKEWIIDGKDWIYFKQGLAQGLGVGIDKKSTQYINDAAEAILNADINEVIAGVKSGEEFEIASFPFEAEHPGHAIQAISALRKYKEAMKSGKQMFNATMVSEYDSVTSGFANKLLQVPILGDILDTWMEKTGIFTNDKASGKGMNDIIAEGKNPDAYRTLVGMVSKAGDKLRTPTTDSGTAYSEKAMASMLDDWTGKGEAIPELIIDGVVTSAARNLFKYPFMIFGYGSSIKTIRQNLSEELSRNIIKGILNGNYAPGSEFMNHLGVTDKNIEELRTDLRTKELDSVWLNKKSVLKEVSNLINNTYGREVEKAMTEAFKPLVRVNEAIIGSTKVMFQSFITELESRSKTKQDKLGRPLTQDEVDAIVLDLEKKFPIIKGPLSQTRSEGAGIIDDKLADINSIYVDKGSVLIKNQSNADYVAQTVQSMIREYAEAHASGAVIPMHWIDGSIIGKLLQKGGVLGIHDAAVLGNNFNEGVQTLNKAAYDIGKNYNLIGEVLESLVETMSTMTDEEIDAIKIDKGTNAETSARDVLASMTKVAEEVNVARTELYSKDITVMNFAGLDGTEYNSNQDTDLTNVMTDIGKKSLTVKAQAKFNAELAKIMDKVQSEEC